MLISTEFGTYNGRPRADVKIECPFCYRKSHIVFDGKANVDAVSDFLSSSTMLTQDLPFEAPVREFFRSGYCRECSEKLFGTSSKKIKYVKRERSVIA